MFVFKLPFYYFYLFMFSFFFSNNNLLFQFGRAGSSGFAPLCLQFVVFGTKILFSLVFKYYCNLLISCSICNRKTLNIGVKSYIRKNSSNSTAGRNLNLTIRVSWESFHTRLAHSILFFLASLNL